jgi:cell division protein FtsL
MDELAALVRLIADHGPSTVLTAVSVAWAIHKDRQLGLLNDRLAQVLERVTQVAERSIASNDRVSGTLETLREAIRMGLRS